MTSSVSRSGSTVTKIGWKNLACSGPSPVHTWVSWANVTGQTSGQEV